MDWWSNGKSMFSLQSFFRMTALQAFLFNNVCMYGVSCFSAALPTLFISDCIVPTVCEAVSHCVWVWILLMTDNVEHPYGVCCSFLHF